MQETQVKCKEEQSVKVQIVKDASTAIFLRKLPIYLTSSISLSVISRPSPPFLEGSILTHKRKQKVVIQSSKSNYSSLLGSIKSSGFNGIIQKTQNIDLIKTTL